jgi:hypothetical protein
MLSRPWLVKHDWVTENDVERVVEASGEVMKSGWELSMVRLRSPQVFDCRLPIGKKQSETQRVQRVDTQTRELPI